MEQTKINQKQFLTKSKISNGLLTVNPYLGCTHGCIYCYASSFVNDGSTKPWGSYVHTKVFPNHHIPKGTGNKKVMFSSVTDAYQPIEKTELATRKILEDVYESDLSFSFLTKSDLIIRDIDLFQKMKHVEIGFSISLDDEFSRWVEPGASLPSKRIDALKTLYEAGIQTYVFVAPIMPYLTDIKKIIEATHLYTSYYMFDKLSIKSEEMKRRIFHFYDTYSPTHYHEIAHLFQTHDTKYYDEQKKTILQLQQEYGFQIKYIYE